MTELLSVTSTFTKHVAARRVSHNSTLPTLICLHSFSTDSELYTPQFNDPALCSTVNIIALDLIGHGKTAGNGDGLDYWEQAKAMLQAMTGLGIKSAYVLGTSQGGFIGARMALLEPERILGLILTGTSLKKETPTLGCWDIETILGPALGFLRGDGSATPDFVLPQPFTDDVVGSGYGASATDDQKKYCRKVHEAVYIGDAGRLRYIMIALCLKNRDDLSPDQLATIKCPVLVMHGDKDIVYSVPLMKLWSAELTGAKFIETAVVEGGVHFLSATSSDLVNARTVAFVERCQKA